MRGCHIFCIKVSTRLNVGFLISNTSGPNETSLKRASNLH